MDVEAKQIVRDSWRRMAGLPPERPRPVLRLDDLRQTEWSPQFERAMRNRLLIGAFRYETFADKRRWGDRIPYDLVGEAMIRLIRFQRDGNKEHLVDAANMALLEFEFGQGHFTPIDDGEHAERL